MFTPILTAFAKPRLQLIVALVGLSSVTGCFWRHHDDDDRRVRGDVYERREGRPAGEYRDREIDREHMDRDRVERERRDRRD